MLNKPNNYLLLIIVLAFGLRLIGIDHSFPFIFHPDEPTIVNSALAIRFFKNPGHFDWPSLYIYLNFFVYMGFLKLRSLIGESEVKQFIFFYLPILWNEKVIFYLITRILSASFGALTVIPVYLSGSKVFNKKTGLLSALAFALIPFHVWHSHYSLPDSPMLFFFTWSVYFSSLILFKNKLSFYFLAGLFAGLAASTKYNGGAVIFCIIFAHILRVLYEKDERLFEIDQIVNLLVAGLLAILGFIVGTPYSVLDYKTFFSADSPKGALWQFTNVGDSSFIGHMSSFLNALGVKLMENFGYSLMVLFLLSILYIVYIMIKERKILTHRDLLFYIISGIVLIFYISGFARDRAHYYFITYPFIILSGVAFFVKFSDLYKFKFQKIMWIIILLPPFYFSLLASYKFYLTDTRVLLYNWLQSNINSNTVVNYDQAAIATVLEELKVKNKIKLVKDDFNPKSEQLYILTDKKRFDMKLLTRYDNSMRRGPEINVYVKNTQ